MKLAIFDFDGTLYKEETFTLLMNHLKKHHKYGSRYKRFYLSILFPYISYKLKMYPEEKMKANLMHKYLKTFRGLSEEELHTYFAEVASEMKADLNNEVIARMEEHAKDGYYIMIVSGSFVPLLEMIAKDLPVDHIIGTEVPFEDGMFDPYKPIDHVHATRKTELIQSFLAEKSVHWDESVAYGDSYSDLSVLQLVGKPVAVAPDELLRLVANEKAWEILES